MKKTIFTFLLLVGLIVSATAQKSPETKAQEKVEELNTELMSIDPSLALTRKQKAQIFELHVQRIKESKKVFKSEKNKAKVKELTKPINKKYYQKIFNEVLTKEQLKARRKAKKQK